MTISTFIIIFHFFIVALFTLRILIRDSLEPATRLAWFFVLIMLPYIGLIVYFLFGEADLGHHMDKRYKAIFKGLRANYSDYFGAKKQQEDITSSYSRPFHLASSINGFSITHNNRAELMRDGTHARQQMLDDINNARESIHILYYIWLEDNTGREVSAALIKASQRGVTCRVIIDGLGSRQFSKSKIWHDMLASGVHGVITLSMKHPIQTLFKSRIDLRNHRKITIIDNKILYCGSQNCADEAFLIKKRYGPWIDILLRFQGSVVQQMQLLFMSDWLATTEQHLSDINFTLPEIRDESIIEKSGFSALTIGDGPTERKNSTTQLLASLIGSATQKLIISTPYFVPDTMTLQLLCSASYRGVEVILIFPKRNDSLIVAAASRSHYFTLLSAGVTIYEFIPGLLHAKTLTIDNKISFIGSTNLDIRSFNLNYENDILFEDELLTKEIYLRQQHYISHSEKVSLKQVKKWPLLSANLA